MKRSILYALLGLQFEIASGSMLPRWLGLIVGVVGLVMFFWATWSLAGDEQGQ